MNRRFLSLVLFAVLIVGHWQLANAQDQSRQDQRLADWLKKYPAADANKDGVLTVEEARVYRQTAVQGARATVTKRPRIAPTHDDLRYGTHPRNTFDLWMPGARVETKQKLPLYVYFHGGGFVGGDKSGFDPTQFLDAGYAVASGNYRFVDGHETLSPAPLLDAARMIQYIRSRAQEWNLDPDRIAVSGNSAGAVISMWIGYHDDLADANSEDPVLRHSSRVKCIVPLNGPSNLDPRFISPNMGGPKHIHGSFPKLFGAPVSESDEPKVRERILETSPMEHVSSDDPPTLAIYGGSLEGIPLPESASTGVLIHHAYFGKVLKERLDEVGVPNQFLSGNDPRKNGYATILSWLKEQL